MFVCESFDLLSPGEQSICQSKRFPNFAHIPESP